jgi:membrane protease YdiL (CAAX protease family)
MTGTTTPTLTSATPDVTSIDAQLPQYSLRKILAVWAAAALPMAALAWVAAPALVTTLDGPGAWPRALIVCLTLGLVWQLVLVLALVRREQGSLRWPVLKEALWLRSPVSPRTGRRGGRLWLLLVPVIVAVAVKEMLPNLPVPGERDMATFIESQTGQDFMSGNWTWFAIILVMWVFNTALGEELLFRGLLLPRMQGVFGRGDWFANGVLFTLYHLHVPWAMPKVFLDVFLYSWPSRRYRSALMGIAVHSAQTVVLSVMVLALVLA